MANDLPALISAEAAVKSKRKDYVSLFDPGANVDDLKKCRSDPATMKHAVGLLKQAGFSVTAIGRSTVRFAGAPGLYEKSFATKLVKASIPADDSKVLPTIAVLALTSSNPPKGSYSFLIPIEKDSPFFDAVHSVFLDPPTAPTSGMRKTDSFTELRAKVTYVRKEDPAVVYLDELPYHLGGPAMGATGAGVTVTVIDDFLHLEHPWFAEKLLSFAGDQKPSWRRSQDRPNSERPKGTHGTKVCSCLLAVAERVNVDFHSTNENDDAPLEQHRFEVFTRIIRSKPAILNCSWGEFPLQLWELLRTAMIEDKAKRLQTEVAQVALATDELDALQSIFTPLRKTLISRWLSDLRENRETLFVWTAGNDNGGQGRPATAYCSHLPNVIVVGGAFYASDAIERGDKLFKPVDGQVPRASHLGGVQYNAKFEHIDSSPYRRSAGKPDGDWCSDSIANEYPAYNPVPAARRRGVTCTICGLTGIDVVFNPRTRSVEGGRLLVPLNASGWKVELGTSMAAPQVAGVCALIRQLWTGAQPEDIKRIIEETATPVTEGVTIEKQKLWDDVRDVKVGLVHIRRALSLATFMGHVANHREPPDGEGDCMADWIIDRLHRLPWDASGEESTYLVLKNGFLWIDRAKAYRTFRLRRKTVS